MAIRLYNTRTRQKEVFEPLDPKNVRMYVCGPTVYDRAHIGNARPVVVFDVLFRLLRHEYGEAHVTYARNFTDVDDKINAKAAETQRDGETLEQTVRRITDETIGWYHEDMDALGALRPTHEPRATEYIAQMVVMIEDLIARGHAYAAEGHVLFEARTDPDYGSLSRRPLDEMRAGARVEVAPYKRDPMDSVLWKPSTDEQPGWDSPWGRGRPGWHIECSAMAGDLLGEAFDIHGGGIDLQFPHHENECAQSRCVGHDFANIWMHNGYLLSEGEKMSKSLGNFFTVADLREEYTRVHAIENVGPALRLRMLQTRYSEPLNWTQKSLEDAAIKLGYWAEALGDTVLPVKETVSSQVVAALSDDLNTSLAIHEIDKLAKISNSVLAVQNPIGFPDASQSLGASQDAVEQLAASIDLLGFSLDEIRDFSFQTRNARLNQKLLSANGRIKEKLDSLLADRQAAKAAKDFAKADAIRDALVSAGVEVKDTPQGAEWSLTPSFDASKLGEVSDA